MTVLLSEGERLVGLDGRPSRLKRPSEPLISAGGGAISLIGEGRTVSYARIYRTQLWVGVVTNKLTRQVARLPLKTYRLNSQGHRERVRDTPLAQLMRAPWAGAAPFQLKERIMLPLLVHGNSLLRKLRVEGPGGPPTGLLPLDWRYVRPHGEPTGPVEVWETTEPGHPRYLEPADVVHFAYQAVDGPIGVSPLQQLGVTIALEEAAQRYAAANFKNAARHSGALVAPKEARLSSDDREEYRREIRELYQGPENAFNVAVLGNGFEWREFGGSAKEAQLVDQRKVNREEVAACYDMPPPVVGILDHATYSNVEELYRSLYRTSLGPPIVLVEETLDAQLVRDEPAFEEDFSEFDLSEVMRGDPKEEADQLAVEIEHGTLTIDEARRIKNRPEFGLAETTRPLYAANNLKPVGVERDDDGSAE